MEGKMYEMSSKEEMHEIDFEMKTKLDPSVNSLACNCKCFPSDSSQTSEAVSATNAYL